ncbi:hypothetical protein L484_015561 [Morus notabilis]|uniref:Uncharacterized protein n=1 Tax=Morus notabilis TaxID=981085 RepID=W9SAY4_9ROSA|nr:hypothetical protein L484_015561 [Morus notabilis]
MDMDVWAPEPNKVLGLEHRPNSAWRFILGQQWQALGPKLHIYIFVRDSFVMPDRWEEHGGATTLDESELAAAREDDRLDDRSELAMEEWASQGLHGVGVGSMRLK